MSLNSLKSYYNSAMATFSSVSLLSEKRMNFRKRRVWMQIANLTPFKKKPQSEKKMNIVVINGNDVAECCRHISQYFSIFENVKLKQENIENFAFSNEALKLLCPENITLIIISPDLLEFIETQPEMIQISKRLFAWKTFAILCGLQMEDITIYHKTILKNFDQWICCVVAEQNKENVDSVMKHICDTLFETNYSIFAKDSFKYNKINRFNLRSFRDNSVARFKLSTNKIDEENRKIFILLQQPLQYRQKLRVIIDFSQQNDFSDIKEVDVSIKNAFTAKIVITEKYIKVAQWFTVNVYVDGENNHFLGSRIVRCASVLKQWLLETVNSPLPILNAELSSTSKEASIEIDKRMTEMLTTFATKSDYTFLDDQNYKESLVNLLPKLLHFSTKYGLEKLTSLLMHCHNAYIAEKFRNFAGVNASQLSRQNNFCEIGKNIEHLLASQCLSPKLDNYTALNHSNSNGLQQFKRREEDSLVENCNAEFNNIRSAIEFDYDVPRVLQHLLHKIKISDHSMTTQSN